jgi:hypothetical protein
MVKERTYTQEQYDDAVKRISAILKIEEVTSIKQLDALLKKNDVYYDIRGGNQTIYEELKQNWKDFVKPEQQIEQEQVRRVTARKPVYSKAERYKRSREIIMIKGYAWLDRENRLKRRDDKLFVVHDGHSFNADNIIIYQNKKTFKWYTRRKPIKWKRKRKKKR